MDVRNHAIQIGKSQFNLQLRMDVDSTLGPHSIAGRVLSKPARRKKHVLVLNSHSLSDYQRCPKRYEFNSIIQIETNTEKSVFKLGTYWGKMLEIYYRYIIEYGHKYDKARLNVRLERLVRRMKNCAENEDNGFDDETRNLLGTRILLYWKTYANENWKPLGVEVGFSIILYEDKNVLFIYEGRPDRIIKIKDPFNPGQWVTCVSDDKTRAMNKDLVDYNNQVNGYLVAAETNWFIYNYMGKQKEGGPAKFFVRQLVYRDSAALEKWKQTTIKWYFKILADRKSGEFLESMQCPGEYSACEYLPLCSANDKAEYNAVMNSRYKKREEERKSW